MSEIVGCIELDGELENPAVVASMCRALEPRAPDGARTWQKDGAALGHALLRTSPGSSVIAQPYSTDGEVWVTSDCHLYGREDVINSLRLAGLRQGSGLTDEQLLLSAYRLLGDEFPSKLVGDFAVAIWDASRKRLMLLRDQLGVRPLFYARLDTGLAFASHMEALLKHPGVGRQLNENYIAEFLVLGSATDPESTVYEQIRRVPAGHVLTFDASGLRPRKYWTPPEFQPARAADPAEYVEEFSALLEQAVVCRMPDGDVALELSGGLDSGSIAAIAARHFGKSRRRVFAYTNTSDALLPADREGHFAGLTARHLGIQNHIFPSENFRLFDKFGSPELWTAEPFANPGLAQPLLRAQMMEAAGCRVLLSGQLGDMLFAGSESYFQNLARRGRLVRLVSDLVEFRRHVGSLGGTGLRSAAMRFLRSPFESTPLPLAVPEWLRNELVERVHLGARWKKFWHLWDSLVDLRGQLSRPWLSQIFGEYEALRAPIVIRHPFSDIRLIAFMLRVPVYMHFDKRILRAAMADRLPVEVLTRPKEGLAGDIRQAKMKAGLVAPLPSLKSIRAYVVEAKFREAYEAFADGSGSQSTWESFMINFPIALAHWMQDNPPSTL